MDDKRPSRIELPAGADRAGARRLSAPAAAPESSARANGLHVIRKAAVEPTLDPAKERKLSMIEDRAKFYQDMRNAEGRRKALQRLTSVAIVLGLTIVVIFTYVYLGRRQEEAERVQITLEKEREQLRVEQERADLALRAKRAENEAAERKRRLAEQAAAREKSEQERLQRENSVRESRELYREILSCCESGRFQFIGACPSNALPGRMEGTCFFLRPFEDETKTAFTVLTRTNGVCSAFRLYEKGDRTTVDAVAFLNQLGTREYLMVTKDAVYFSSSRKKPHVAQLPKGKTVDLRDELFGTLAPEIKRFDLDFEDVQFEIVFVPDESKKIIITDVIPYGGTYRLERVREAVEEAFPPSAGRGGVSGKYQKYKRTVILWDGAHIKKGVDGVTYVPRVAPLATHYGYADAGGVRVYGSGWDNDRYLRTRDKRLARSAHTQALWQSLYDEAIRQDKEESEFYSKAAAERAKSNALRDEGSRAKYKQRIDSILERGRLFWRVRLGHEQEPENRK